MAHIVTLPEEAVDHVFYNGIAPEAMQFINNQFQNANSYLTERGAALMEYAQNVHNTITSSAVYDTARNMVRQVGIFFDPNAVYYLNGLNQIQNANLNMQRYVMAYPELREIYHNQKCDGYSDTYVDLEPATIGESHYEYRQVMDGIVYDDKDRLCYTHYLDELRGRDKELDFHEKTAILNTWDIISLILENSKEDVTSPQGNKRA